MHDGGMQNLKIIFDTDPGVDDTEAHYPILGNGLVPRMGTRYIDPCK